MTERRIVMFNQVSADGFFSDLEGRIDWAVRDPELQRRALAGMPHTDGMLFGRRTYQQFAAFWPQALEEMNRAGPHGEDKHDPGFVAMARWLNATRKLVFSKTLHAPGWQNSELERELTPERICAIKREPGKDLLIFGSGSLVSQLSEHGLIDEYRFVVSPLLLGSGNTLLGNLSRRVPLSLVGAEAFPSGSVLLTYTPARKSS
jgi:dihydrofolate reductase